MESEVAWMFGLFQPKGKQALDKALELLHKGKKSEALAMALQAAKTAPEGWGVASGLLLNLGRYGEALEAAEQALESDLSEEAKAAAWNAKGQALIHLGRVAEARKCFGPALKQPAQALSLAGHLAFAGAPDAPARDGLMLLEGIGVRAWFPGPPQVELEEGASCHALATPDLGYTLLCNRIDPDVLSELKRVPNAENLASNLEHVIDDGFEVGYSQIRDLYLDFWCCHPAGVFQIGRFWCDLVGERFVTALVRFQDLSQAGRPELGRFLNLKLV